MVSFGDRSPFRLFGYAIAEAQRFTTRDGHADSGSHDSRGSSGYSAQKVCIDSL